MFGGFWRSKESIEEELKAVKTARDDVDEVLEEIRKRIVDLDAAGKRETPEFESYSEKQNKFLAEKRKLQEKINSLTKSLKGKK